jgi:hypothetical protein
MPDAIGEVIASSTRQFSAEVYDTAERPAFGSWVRVRPSAGGELYAVVSHIEMGSYDGSRQAVALGMTAEERQREMPMVQELLRTTLRAQVLAFRTPGAEDRLRQTLPPHPPDIHDFVHPCADAHVRDMGAPYDFLRTLVQHPDSAVPVDDLLVAVLRQIGDAHASGAESRSALVAAGRALSRLLDDDHERLQSILRRVN